MGGHFLYFPPTFVFFTMGGFLIYHDSWVALAQIIYFLLIKIFKKKKDFILKIQSKCNKGS